ncbi:MAG: LysR family transcriptional regulator [Rectinemataceae bacterium]
MELRYLKYFVTVAEEMNFVRAAQRLNITQPPLSRQIMDLESELGVLLLDRSGAHFRLTEAGIFFKHEAARILDQVAALVRQTQLVGGNAENCVRIGYVGSIMSSFLPELLAFLREKRGDIRMEIVELPTEEQVDALVSGRIDMGLLRSWAPREGIVFEALGEESLSIVCPTSALPLKPERTELSYFASMPFVSFSSDATPGLVERINDICTKNDFTPQTAFDCNQFSSVLKLVASGLGWSIIPTYALHMMTIEGVGLIPLHDKILFGLAYKAGPLPERVRETVESTKSFIDLYENITKPEPRASLQRSVDSL